MKDIDFDELDRAVNSLMSGVPKAEPMKDDTIKTLALDAGDTESQHGADQLDAPMPTPSVASDVPNEPEVHKEELARSTPPASYAIVPPAARRGRFMDVVRPNASDTRKPAPSLTPSRHGATIEPTTGFAQPTSSSVDGITAPAQHAPKQLEATSSGDWPDPLAAVDFSATTDAVTAKAAQSEVSYDRMPRTSADTQQDDPSALAPSPFLPDAKVEKRPLGRLDDAEMSSQPSPKLENISTSGVSTSSGSAPQENGVDSKGDSAVPQQPLPVELGREVMAIEADTSTMTEEEDQPAPEVKPAPVRVETIPQGTATPRPTMTSIPQQYKVQPKAADEPSTGAIYDTATYHQPLAHPAKKKPGWLWVMVIILILLLGAASGAAVYFFGLI